jgi:putative transposase
MAHHSTVFSQLLKWLPRHEFENLAREHHSGSALRKTSRWSQFVAMGMGQLAGRTSLRDVIANAAAQAQQWYHLGARPVKRTTLARVNEQQPASLYEALFGRLYQRCQRKGPGHGFRFKNPLYSLDSSLIDLSLQLFPWSRFALSKGAVKLHVQLDHGGHLPAFARITDSHTSDIEVARTLQLPVGSIVVFDKGYGDYSWYNSLTDGGIYFVTRLKKNARYRVIERRPVPARKGVLCDQRIKLTGKKSHSESLPELRRVVYRDPESKKRYEFLTNHIELAAATIAAIYKQRWQIELFFKWIKQNLKIKAFLGTSLNAVKTQLWIALCLYLLLAYLKFLSRITLSMQQMLRLLQMNLFAKRSLTALLSGEPPPPDPVPLTYRLQFT